MTKLKKDLTKDEMVQILVDHSIDSMTLNGMIKTLQFFLTKELLEGNDDDIKAEFDLVMFEEQ